MKTTKREAKTRPGSGKKRAYRLDELAAATKVPVRTIRYYIQRGLLEAPRFRGPSTVYDEHHKLRLEAIRALQNLDLPLEFVARYLVSLQSSDLEAVARGELAPEVAAAIPGRGPKGAGLETSSERRLVWRLGEGLELHLTESASAATRALAERVAREFASRSGGDKE